MPVTPPIPEVIPGQVLGPIIPAPALVINAHGQLWVNSGPVLVEEGGVYTQAARIEWPNHGLINLADRTPLEYFLLTFPHAQLDKIVSHTNRQLTTFRLPADLTVMELQRYFGIRLVMTLEHGHGAIESYWDTEVTTGFTRPRDYGRRTGMSLTRFKNIARSLCFHDTTLVSVILTLINVNTLVLIFLIFFYRMIHGLTFEALWKILTEIWRSF